MKKLCLLLLCGAILLLSACGGGEKIFDMSEDQALVDAGFPITVQDASGRELRFDQKPEAVLCVDGDSLNRVCAAGGSASVVECLEEAKGTLYALLSQKATPDGKTAEYDLTVIGGEGDQGLFGEETPVYFSRGSTSDLHHLYSNLLPLAQVLGGETASFSDGYQYGWQLMEKAEKLVRTVEFSQRPSVLFLTEESSHSACSKGSGRMMNSILETAGAVNSCPDWAGENTTLSLTAENLREIQPDVIFIPWYAEYSAEDIRTDEDFRDLKAVQEGRVYVVPGAVEPWYTDTPGAFPGLCWVLHTLYPDRYSYDEMLEDIQGYYRIAYQLTLTEEDFGLLP